MLKINIRPAQEKDIPFLGGVMYVAAQSHLAQCPWDVIFGEPKNRTLTLLQRTLKIPELYWSYFGNFWLAEVNAKPVAAMCAFAPAVETGTHLADLQLSIFRQNAEYSESQIMGVSERLAIATLGLPDELNDAWGIESVAVLPEFRGKAVVDRLFEKVFDKGRAKGFKRAQIMCLKGNHQAQKTFERNGFKNVMEKEDAAFEKLFGTAGAKLLVKKL